MRAAPRVVQNSQYNIPAKFTVAYRLLRGDGFGHVFHAESVANKHFRIFFSRNSEKNARLGIIASKKKLPNATDRNRVKRIVREVFRHHHIKLCKLDIVVMVKHVYSAKHGASTNNLESLFSKAENICKKLQSS